VISAPIASSPYRCRKLSDFLEFGLDKKRVILGAILRKPKRGDVRNVFFHRDTDHAGIRLRQDESHRGCREHDEQKNGDNNDITRGAHGWIKNHSLYSR